MFANLCSRSLAKVLLTTFLGCAVSGHVVGAERAAPVAEGGSLEEPFPVVSSHRGIFGGITVDFTATVGAQELRDGTGAITARLVYIAYVRDNVPDKNGRPVLFLFNGGPGSSSQWLHIGAFGPKRVVFPQDLDAPVAPPFSLVDNNESPLDQVDLVFFDPVETGFSRLASGAVADEFHTVAGDASAAAQFINAWCRQNGRLKSPKYILGESYGTIRAAALTDALAHLSEPISLDGVLLIGQALNIIEIAQRPDNIVSYMVSLPTLSALAWYHHRVKRDGRTFQTFLAESREFAHSIYLPALASGSSIDTKTEKRVANGLERLTGLPAELFIKNGLRVTKEQFRAELLRDERKVLGNSDGRYTALIPSEHPTPALGLGRDELPDSADKVRTAFTTTFQTYLKEDLNIARAQDYLPSDPIPARWSYGTSNSPFSNWPYMSLIAGAMSANPKFRLFLINGYFDLQTTTGSTDYAIDQSRLPRERVTKAYYPSGHMLYTDDGSRRSFMADIRRFLTTKQ
jgi:carboxypeptidase C (cathepsin A)